MKKCDELMDIDLMKINWNRLSELTYKKNKTRLDDLEIDMRISFQNLFSNKGEVYDKNYLPINYNKYLK